MFFSLHSLAAGVHHDELKIKQTIQYYVTGYLQAEKEILAKAFYPETRLYSVDEGKIDKTEMSEWFKNLDERKAKGDIRTAKLKIIWIDITQDTAVAKIQLKFAKVQYTDYLSLLQVNHQWTIVGKVYSSHP